MKIVMLLGGSSPERFVSFDSGKAIGEVISSLGHELIYVDPSRGDCILSKDQLEKSSDLLYTKEQNADHISRLMSSLFTIKDKINPDLVFLGLHGGYGEDGLVQDLMDRIGLKYTGSSAVSSKISMNKFFAKQIMAESDVPVLKSVRLKHLNDSYASIETELGFPVIVKPNHGGSSVALCVVNEVSGLKAAIEKAFTVDSEVLIEPFIKGREITITVLGERVYPAIEIKPTHDLYDYECKYTEGMSEYIVPAEMPTDLTENMKSDALKCYRGLGLEVYGRIDFLLKNDGTYICLEANTLPGMTSTSLVPKSVKSEGMTFEALVEQIINLSLEK
jgi:D-alanine-D-alanine ligase